MSGVRSLEDWLPRLFYQTFIKIGRLRAFLDVGMCKKRSAMNPLELPR